MRKAKGQEMSDEGRCDYHWHESTIEELRKERDAMEKSLKNCRLLAAREFHKTNDEVWGHVLRFCKEAGVEGSLLRESPAVGPEKET